MGGARRTVVAGTGSYLPTRRVPNQSFLERQFVDSTGKPFEQPTIEVVRKFEAITGIAERRYVSDDLVTSDIAALAGERAIESAGADPESLDYVIVAHNFGDVAADNRRSEMVPSLAARVKSKLGIRNPATVAYDLPFGCPGWLQGVIQADYFLRSGDSNRALVIGAETLSRVCDPHDRDSMIYADGAGAALLEARSDEREVGILSHATRSDTHEHAFLLRMGRSFCREDGDSDLFLKMDGHKIYEYAVKTVPALVSQCLARAGAALADVAKLLLHQANAKMDEAIVKRLLRAGSDNRSPEEVAPLTVGWLGNSSVATLPTLLDLLTRGKLSGHSVRPGDLLVLAAVGAGMNVNAITYRLP